MNKKENYNVDDLVKKIDLKIAELEKQENPNELLKKALIKKNIISPNKTLSDTDIERIFDIIKTNI